ncbi:OPT oligopeptide transporter [Mycena kentingensis (nom. inval.)]|nr:OPT oligopeptide transporter [Mycena kentingensis (nom. inval.)]
MSTKPAVPVLHDEKKDKSSDTESIDKSLEKEHVSSLDTTEEEENVGVIEKAEDVALAILSTHDDPELPSVTFRSLFLGIGLSAFASVLATIYTFKPQNASVSQLFCLIIAYVLGTAMHSVIPSHGFWRYLNPGPFNIKEHTFIVIMSGTASNVAVGMEIIAALDLFYDLKLNAAVAIFQIFATQMLGYGVAGILRTFLVYPTYAFYPTYISVVNLLQSLHWRVALNAKKRQFFWIVFAAIFFYEWIPQYPFPLLTAISIICLADNGRHEFVRNLFGAGSSNEGIGFASVSTSWTLITQGNPLIWPLQTQINSYIGMWLGYAILTGSYYANRFNGRDLPFMSTSLFGEDGSKYNQTLIITDSYGLNKTALAEVGLPRYTTTYAISQMCYNLSLGAAVTYLFVWHWAELKAAFGGLRFLKRGHADVDDPHYKEMQKYPEVPQWVYATLFVVSLAVGIGCSYAGPHGTVLMPAWGILYFTFFSCIISVVLGFITATTGFSISIKYAIQIMAAFIFPGQPIPVMYANLYGNSTSFQTLYLLQDLKLGQYTKLPPRITFVMQIIVANNRETLKDPIGTRLWSGWIVQQYNSASIAMGALGKELFAYGKPYWLVPFAMFIGLFIPLPFWLVWKLSGPESRLAKGVKYLNLPIILLYIGYLPYSVNGQWWSCMIIGPFSQYYLRKYKPSWFKKYNYIMSAALDGGSQVILFILSFAVFGASGKGVDFPYWWGNPENLSVDRRLFLAVSARAACLELLTFVRDRACFPATIMASTSLDKGKEKEQPDRTIPVPDAPENPYLLRITAAGKMSAYVTFALAFFEKHPSIAITLHTLPLPRVAKELSPDKGKQPEGSAKGRKNGKNRDGDAPKPPPSSLTVPRLVSVVEIIKREYVKALPATGGVTGLYQLNEIGILEDLGPEYATENRAEDVDPEEARARAIAAQLNGKKHVQIKQTPYMKITLSTAEIRPPPNSKATQQAPHKKKISKSAKARAKKRENKLVADAEDDPDEMEE